MIYTPLAAPLFLKHTVFRYSYCQAFYILAVILIAIGGVWGQAQSPARSAARSAYERGQEALRKGDLATARIDFEQAVRRAPSNAQFQAALGWVLWQLGELDGAANHFKAVLRISPGFVPARLNLAGVLAQQGHG